MEILALKALKYTLIIVLFVGPLIGYFWLRSYLRRREYIVEFYDRLKSDDCGVAALLELLPGVVYVIYILLGSTAFHSFYYSLTGL